jgi:2-keto-4-pentenoate hydratase
LRAGEYVTTGSLCGLLSVDVPCRVTGTIEGLGDVAIGFVRG